MFHCGDLKERNNVLCHSELVSASLTKCVVKFPLLEARDRVRCLAEHKKSEILRSSSTDLLQSNGLSLRMTSALDNSNKLRHPERSEGSLTEQIIANSGIAELMSKSKFANVSTSSQPSPQGEGESCHAELVSASLSERIGNCPSPREEGVGERVLPFAKRETLKRSWIIGGSAGSTQPSPRRASLLPKSAVHGDIMKKCAFTLAEVLITLGIIGVVAAITLPNLMTAYKARTLRSQFMKSYSLIQQAYKMMQADEVSTSPSDYDRSSDDATFKTVFQRYFTGTTDCGYTKSSPCYNPSNIKYKSPVGNNTLSSAWLDDGQFVLKDGTLFMFENPSSSGGEIRVWIFVDINGINGRPNRLGYDLFIFALTDNGIKPMGDEGTPHRNSCAIKESSYGYNGFSCASDAKNDPDYFKKVVKAIK